MADYDLDRPDFAAATDKEVAKYLWASWRWADFEGIGAAEQELKRRGRNNVVRRHPGLSSR